MTVESKRNGLRWVQVLVFSFVFGCQYMGSKLCPSQLCPDTQNLRKGAFPYKHHHCRQQLLWKLKRTYAKLCDTTTYSMKHYKSHLESHNHTSPLHPSRQTHALTFFPHRLPCAIRNPFLHLFQCKMRPRMAHNIQYRSSCECLLRLFVPWNSFSQNQK